MGWPPLHDAELVCHGAMIAAIYARKSSEQETRGS